MVNALALRTALANPTAHMIKAKRGNTKTRVFGFMLGKVSSLIVITAHAAQSRHASMGRVTVMRTQSAKVPSCVAQTAVQAERMVWTAAQVHAQMTLTA